MIISKTLTSSYLIPVNLGYQAININACNELQPFVRIFRLQDLFSNIEESADPVESCLKFVAQLCGDGPGLEPDTILEFKNKFSSLPDRIKKAVIPLIPTIINNINNDRSDLGAGTGYSIPNTYNRINPVDPESSGPILPPLPDIAPDTSPSNRNPENISLGRTGPCNYLSGVSDKVAYASKPSERASASNYKRWDNGDSKILQPAIDSSRGINNKKSPDLQSNKISTTLVVDTISNTSHIVPTEIIKAEKSLITNDDKSIANTAHNNSNTVTSSITPLIASQESASDIIANDKIKYGDCFRIEHEFNHRFNPNDPDHRFEKVSPIMPDSNPDIVGDGSVELVTPNGKVLIPGPPTPNYDSRSTTYAPTMDQLLDWSALDSGNVPLYLGSAGDKSDKNNKSAGVPEIETSPESDQ